MKCWICKLFFRYLLNWLVLIDHALNTLLLGDADETISQRVARAREAGYWWAAQFCAILTVGQYFVTFGHLKRDHCTYALSKGSSNAAEIFDLNKMRFHRAAASEVIVDDRNLET